MAAKTYGDGANPLAVDPAAVRDIVWDDLQGVPGAFPVQPLNNPTWRDYAFGIGGGATFRVLGFAVGDIQTFVFQSRHAAKLNSTCEFHLHFCTPTDGTGDRFRFQTDVIACPANGVWAAVTGSPFTSEETMAGDYSDTQRYFDLASIPAVNSGVSTLYQMKIERIAATANEYAGEVYAIFADMHMQLDAVGSRQELVK
jgi:hypothetical protein